MPIGLVFEYLILEKNMIYKSIAIIAFSFFLTDAWSAYPSARRPLDVPYEVYEMEALNKGMNKNLRGAGKTALTSSKIFSTNEFLVPAKWSRASLQERFIRVRDYKFLSSNGSDRRASWLYPDDGCYSRAAMVNRNFFRWFEPIPNKVFAFGNLRVSTHNSPYGKVGWWYHVATIVEVEGENYVIDPSIEFNHPLLLSEWVARMGNPNKIKVAICHTGTYTPGDNCDRETKGLELSAEKVQSHYLNLEYERMKKLGRLNEL